MDPMELVSKIAALNSWVQANAPKEREEISSRQVKVLREVYIEFQERMYMVMPPGDPCTHCKGTGIARDA